MENIMEVQKQIKENASEVNDFLKDLDSWAAEMKVKDNKLREEKLKKSSSSKIGKENSSPAATNAPDNQPTSKPMITEMPPSATSKPIATTSISMKHKQTEVKPPSVSLPKKKDKEKEKTASKADQIPSPPKKERIKAYEYDKWDKFDVEEECSKLDQAAGSDESSSDEIDEEMENARLKQQALAERERGNTFFKQGKYDKAIERYTAGIQIDPYCPLLPANRAMAFLKENKFGAAEQDCSLSLSLDPTYIKALQRRMTARIGLKKYHEALMDCEKILQIEPTNKQAREEELVLKDKVAAAARYAAAKNNTDAAAKDKSKVEEEAVKKEVIEKTQKLNLKDNMKSMFAPVKEKPAVERLEPMSDVSPGLLLQSSPSDESCEKKVRFAEEKAPWPTPDPNLVIHPVNKPPHQRSKKPMKKITIHDQEPKSIKPAQQSNKPTRMKIIEVKGDEDEVDSTSVAMDTSSQDLPVEIPSHERFVELPSGDDTALKNVDFSKKNNQDTKSSENTKKFPESNNKITEIAQETNKDESKMEVDEDKSYDTDDVTENSADTDDVMDKSADGFASKSRGLCRKVEKEINAALQEKEETEDDVKVPEVPKASAQFVKDWRSLKTTELRYKYISQFKSESFPKIFKNQLESQLFSDIIQVLQDSNPPPQIVSVILVGLSSLPRISALSMFLAPAETKILSSLLEVATPNLDPAQIQTVKKSLSL